ncbi:trafficking PGA2-domain-containing protein [Hypoxylon crocopeplum]|nr:trafficking PGA2-domain-containing protein [Hypoxylon crocopeplum]
MSELVDLVTHLFDSVSQLFNLVRSRFSNNISESFTSMTPKQWIRLVIIVGAYALLRPYIIKMGAKFQEKQFEKQFEEEKQAEISPNQLRGEIGLPEDSDEDEQAETTASDWGKKARKRQRNMIKKLLDAEEKRLQELQEDEEDKDIEQYLKQPVCVVGRFDALDAGLRAYFTAVLLAKFVVRDTKDGPKLASEAGSRRYFLAGQVSVASGSYVSGVDTKQAKEIRGDGHLLHERWILLGDSEIITISEDRLWYADVPPGQVRTEVNPPTQRGDLMAAGISTTIIAGMALGLRLYTRFYVLRKKLEPDDWLVIAAFIISVAMLAFVQKDIDHGLTYHVWDIPQATYHIGERLWGLLAYLSFILSVSFAKMSMLVLYLRLAPHLWFRVTCYTCIAIIACYSVTAALVESLACRPLEGIVDESLDAVCYDSYPAYISLSSLRQSCSQTTDIGIDIIILLLPIPLVIRMQLPNRQKLSVILLFATGIVVCAVALKRVTYIPVLEASEDYDWDAVPDMILCFIEVNLGIVCASVPALRPFFSRYLPILLASRRKNSDADSGPNPNRVLGTIEKQNMERQHLKRRNVVPEESIDLSSFSDASTSRYQDSRSEDEESRLWPPRDPNKSVPLSNVSTVG